MQRIIVLLTIVSALACSSSQAAELRLRQQCSPHGSVVTLGDVAEIYTADAQQAEKLAAIELFPAPPAAQQRVLRVREVQDLLTLRGINLAEHQFSGSSQVVLTSASDPAQADQIVNILGSKRTHRRVQEAILQYLSIENRLQRAANSAIRSDSRPGSRGGKSDAADIHQRRNRSLDRNATLRSDGRFCRRAAANLPSMCKLPSHRRLWRPCIPFPAVR